MQANFQSPRILLPARRWFILASLLVALLVNFLPDSPGWWMPDWTALVLCFWCVREPRRVNMGTAFICGLLMDVADGAVLGQHAVAYVLLAWASAALSRRILWFSLSKQAMQIMPLLLVCQGLQIVLRMMAGQDFPGWVMVFMPCVAALCWLPLTFILLFPQYRPVEQNPDRPL